MYFIEFFFRFSVFYIQITPMLHYDAADLVSDWSNNNILLYSNMHTDYADIHRYYNSLIAGLVEIWPPLNQGLI